MKLHGAQLNSVGDLLDAATAGLQALDTARLDAEVLLCMILDVGREYCHAHPEAQVPAAAAADFWRLVTRRQEGFPVAYLTGQREFWSLDLSVNQFTLIPRPETEQLVETALDLARTRDTPELLELGTGSGAVSIALARERPDARITATDLCRHALELAQHNAARHGIGNLSFLVSDWYAALGARRFDLILSNPPYVDEQCPALWQAPLRHEPRLALDGGRGGLAAVARIVAGAGRHLLPGACLLLEHGFDQGESVRRLLRQHGFTDVETRRDGGGQERISSGRWQ
jgi:release factor glutamine methyltransferase